MHAISSYRGNRPTNKQAGPITIHCAAKLSAQCEKFTFKVFAFCFSKHVAAEPGCRPTNLINGVIDAAVRQRCTHLARSYDFPQLLPCQHIISHAPSKPCNLSKLSSNPTRTRVFCCKPRNFFNSLPRANCTVCQNVSRRTVKPVFTHPARL